MNKGLEGLKGDSRRGSMAGSRRGSMIPARSRQGSLVLAGQERRGSLYDKDVTTRASGGQGVVGEILKVSKQMND